MKRIMKRNQVVITALAVMLAVAGYLTYAGKQDLNTLTNGEAAALPSQAYDTYVAGAGDEQEVAATGQNASSAEETVFDSGETAGASSAVGDQSNLEDINSLDYDIDDPGEAVLASGLTVSDYLATARLTREQVRGKSKEELLKVIDDDTADTVSRQAAVDKMVELTDNSDKECAAETLLCAKGFDNSIVSITDGKVDVVICKSELSEAELAQIEDIVKRKTDVSASEIVISLMDVSQ